MSGDQQQSFPSPFAPIQGFLPGTVLQGFVSHSMPPTSTLNLPTVSGPMSLQMAMPTHNHGFQPSHLNLSAPLPVKMPVPAHNHGIPVREPSPEMRAYRACLHCRGRKTKCDLSGNGGQVPCKRCKRENRECILGESHRGGRRERKKRTRDNSLDDSISNSVPESPAGQEPLQQPLPQTGPPPPSLPQPFQQPIQNHQDTHQAPDLQQSHQYPESPFGHGSQYNTPMDQRSQWQSSSPVACASPGSDSRSKARSMTTMSDKETQEIQGMIDTTIDRLEKSSAGAINMGSRYYRLLKLLWQKSSQSPQQAQKQVQSPHSIQSILEPPHNLDPGLIPAQVFGPPHFDASIMPNLDAAGRELGFSWLDLGGAWYYVNQNYANQNGGSVGRSEMDEMIGNVSSGLSSFEVHHSSNN